MSYLFKDDLLHVQTLLEKRLSFFLEQAQKGTPDRLAQAMSYGLLDGGKRLRPFLHLSAARFLGGDEETAVDIACALETVHCYSLIHDDLPCMDDSSLRRGKPSVQAAFDPATALLAGNALYTLALEILTNLNIAEVKRLALIRALSKASGASGMMGGQYLDMTAMASPRPLTLEEITHLQRLKTGALIEVCLEAANIAFDPSPERARALTLYGRNFGLLFQISDDLLDAKGTPETLGKPTQADASKATFISRLGLKGAEEKATALVEQACQVFEIYGESAMPLTQVVRALLTRVA
ncbi:MAG: polyprenyl synthetase family protein [Alphaproteobacteria bacterium]|nr:polyprenyl synthetase family protein [Alphaproteobacteria bacterium]